MEQPAMDHLRRLYGMDPDTLPLAMQFPRVPPGLPNAPGIRGTRGGYFGRMERPVPGLDDYREAYLGMAAGLARPSPRLVPPGHPLYTGRETPDALRAENARLRKENTELKGAARGTGDKPFNIPQH